MTRTTRTVRNMHEAYMICENERLVIVSAMDIEDDLGLGVTFRPADPAKMEKVCAGVYLYRNHRICREDFEGPEGDERRCWSISGDLDGPNADSAHEGNPVLETRAAAKLWLDSFLDGKDVTGWACHAVERQFAPKVWGN